MPFDDGNLYDGEVKSFDRETGYRVSYSDGTQQDYAILELSRMTHAPETTRAQKLGAITLLLCRINGTRRSKGACR